MLGACAGRVESSVRKKAAADFGCTAEKISIGETQDPWKRTALYRAHGCDKTHMYEATCHLFACKATTAARLGLAKPIDDPGDVEYTPEEDKRRADEAKPKRFDVKVFSLCKDAEVKLLIDGAAQQSKYLLKGGMAMSQPLLKFQVAASSPPR